MRNRRFVILGFVIVTACFTGETAQAQKLPASTTIGTNPAGQSLLFGGERSGQSDQRSRADAVAWFSLIPAAAPSCRLLDNGELDFGIINAVDMGLAYQGQRLKIGGRNPMPHTPRTRLIMRGSPLLTSMVSRKDGPVKTVYDVKGKRVTGDYPAHLAVWFSVFGSLATGGLTWDDVKVVPVPAVNDGIDALVQGRAEVSNHTVGIGQS